MRYLVELLAITIRANIIRLTSRKSNNISKNQSQQYDERRILSANRRLKQKSKHKNKEKFKFLDKEHIKEMQYISLTAIT